MTLLNKIAENWFVLLQSAGIVGGLLFTGFALRADARAKQIQSMFALTQQHREIWSLLYSRPELARVLEPKPDLKVAPVTPAEEMFVRFLILHLSGAHRAIRSGLFTSPERLREDISSFFSLPIPRAVWEKNCTLQNNDFVAFVKRCRHSE